MKIVKSELDAIAVKPSQYPTEDLPEIALLVGPMWVNPPL